MTRLYNYGSQIHYYEMNVYNEPGRIASSGIER